MDDEIYKLLKEKDEIIKECHKEINRLKEMVEFYKKESYTDSLTNLGNRRSLESKKGYDVVILGDIDHFKKINDKYGHDCGDKVIVEISSILKKCTRNTDLVCRWGGEEFVVLLKDCKINDAFDFPTQSHDVIRSELLVSSHRRMVVFVTHLMNPTGYITHLEHEYFNL